MDLEVSKIISSLRNSLGKKYSSEEALLLLDNEMAKFVVDYINNFTNLNAEVAKKLIEIGRAGVVVKNRDLFVGFKLDSDTALKMIKSGQLWVVVSYKDLFDGFKLDSNAALKMIEGGQAEVVVVNIKDFTDLNAEVAKKLIEIGQAGLVVKNKDLFVGFKLDSDAAIKMIENGQDKIVVKNIEKFRNLNTAVVVKLMEVGYTEEVLLWIKNSHQSFDIEGMLKDKDKNFSFNSYYVYEIVKHPSLISDICS